MVDIILNMAFDAFYFFICMCLSELLMEDVIFGGALYLLGKSCLFTLNLFKRSARRSLPKGLSAGHFIILALVAALNISLVVVFPSILNSPNYVKLLCFVLIAVGHQACTDLASRGVHGRRPLALILIHCLFVAFASFYLFDILSAQLWISFTVILIISGVMLCLRQLRSSPAQYADDTGVDPTEVSALKLYGRMLFNTLLAVNISVLSFICYISFLPDRNFTENFAMLMSWMLCICLLSALIWRVINRPRARRYEKPSVFVFGASLWCVASIGQYNGIFITPYISMLLWCGGLGCMNCIIVAMAPDAAEVAEFTFETGERAFTRYARMMREWASLVSYLLFLVMLTLTGFIMQGKWDLIEARLGVRDLYAIVLMLLPVVFVLIALFSALVQPMDRQFMGRLRRYREAALRGEDNLQMKTQLHQRLVKGTKRIGIRVLCFFLRPLLPCKIVHKERVDDSEPMVLVCNHLEVYGPVIAILHTPFFFRPWVISNMIDEKAVEEHLRPGVEKLFLWLPSKARAALPRIAKRMVLFVMRAVNPVPVYRGNIRDAVKTIRITAEAMMGGDSILLFPENPQASGSERYVEEGVSAFFSGFSQIGAEYYKLTGRRVTFYPMYIDKKKRTMTFFNGITFDPSHAKADEKRRIVSYLQKTMNEASAPR